MILQDSLPSAVRGASDIMQYFIVVGIVGVLLKLRTIETLLSHPDRGLIKEVGDMRRRRHEDANVWQDHGNRLEVLETVLEEWDGVERRLRVRRKPSEEDRHDG